MGGRSARWSVLVLVACGLTACGGGHGVAPATEPAPATPTADAGIAQLAAAVPRADDLPDRLLVEGTVLATSDLVVVNALSGPVARLYALVPAGPVLHPTSPQPSCEMFTAPDDGTEATRRVNAASSANFEACRGQSGCGQVVIASIAGESRKAASENAEKLAEFEDCIEHLTGFNGPPADGRILLQPAPASPSAALPVAVVVYPSADAFTASARDVAGSAAFRTAPVVGRFEPIALAGCGLQFYPATASALVWCGDPQGPHDPEHDATVGDIVQQLAAVSPAADGPGGPGSSTVAEP